jgi:membrane protease YdiL (CAAX protease family)
MADLSGIGVTRMFLRESLMHSVLITGLGLIGVTVLGMLMGSWGKVSIGAYYVIYYVLISVPVQEIVFRGVLQTRLEKMVRPGLAIIMTSLIFGLVHIQNPLLVILAGTAGLMWGWSFHRKRNLAGPMASHAILGLYLFSFVI